jgi:hypothetical protein
MDTNKSTKRRQGRGMATDCLKPAVRALSRIRSAGGRDGRPNEAKDKGMNERLFERLVMLGHTELRTDDALFNLFIPPGEWSRRTPVLRKPKKRQFFSARKNNFQSVS